MSSLVSIIMPTYNCADFISESIESVINQTYKEWELIIIDDQSTDDTKNIISKRYSNNPKIIYHCLNQNSGAAIARNKGVELAKGDFIAFIDSDDLWKNNKLELQVQFMIKNNYNFTYTAYQQINEKGELLNKIIKAPNKVNYNGVLLSCPIGNSSVIYNSKKIGKVIIPNIRKRNDDALWLKILKIEEYAFGLNQVLMSYRLRENSLSRNKIELVKYHWYLYREIEHLSILRSLYHLGVWVIIKVLRIK